MNSEIKITHELRPCYLEDGNVNRKALFHQWTEDGNAIVELEDGKCTTIAPWSIKFVHSEIDNYCFE